MYTILSLQDFFLNYRTIDIKIDIFSLNHRIINQIVKSPLSHSIIRTSQGSIIRMWNYVGLIFADGGTSKITKDTRICNKHFPIGTE
jgi:hypothetical protein